MNYTEAKAYITDASSFGSVMGLESIKELLKRLANPQNHLKFIHIAGTNGKGSVSAYLSSILKHAGYKVGRYSSPPLHSYREVMQINDQWIDRENIAHHMTAIKPAIDSMLADGLAHPTRFEMEAALAFSFFNEQGCDLVVLETGLGGLEDATNVVQTTLLEIITPISMDHMDILGHSLSEIAVQKAGIIKPNTVVVASDQSAAAKEILENTSRDRFCSLTFVDAKNINVLEYGLENQVFNYTSAADNTYHSLTISLAGTHQFKNAAIAIEAAEALNKLGYPIALEALTDGLRHTQWKGRFTSIHENPRVIIDGAHNEDASRRLAESIKMYFKNRRIIYLLGIFEDKEYQKIIENTIQYADIVITINAPEIKRLMPAATLAEFVRQYHQHVISSTSIEDAITTAFRLSGKEDVMIAFGSLSFLGSVESIVAGMS